MRPCNTEITREFDIDIPLRIHISYDKIKLNYVHDPEKKETLAETVDKALRQIDEKQYDAELLVKGIAGSPAVDDDNKIRSYWENVMEQADECMYKQKSEHKHRAGGSQERR